MNLSFKPYVDNVMTKLTQEEMLEIFFTEQFAEMKYKALTKDWEEARRAIFYDAIKQQFQPMEVLGLNWGIFLDIQLTQTMEGYDAEERDQYIAQKIKEELSN